ncbi:hypothetical protein [uncultured Reyranella sp.]|uniref:hypothetical protein n=1 Tax=uncultured Reyranella sp. TaxID=735512 RepID=UPI0025E18BB9|nr:hypothetical protein [uncultured Reyranella sp.]
MDTETDLFVQAFWVKCRDIIRPELDEAVNALRHAGHDANISTLEFSPDEKTAPESGPTLTLTIHTSGTGDTRVLRYRGDVATREIEVMASGCKTSRYDLSAVTQAGVKHDIALCFGSMLKTK